MDKKKNNLLRLSDLWRWDGKISRLTYATWGGGLVAVKYALDTFVATQIFHRAWSWLNYISPGQAVDVLAMSNADQVFFASMILLSLPFIWVGIVLTMRRLRAAGLPVWLCKLFFIPVVNLLVFASLCILPSQGETDVFSRPDRLLDADPDDLDRTKELPAAGASPAPSVQAEPPPSTPPAKHVPANLPTSSQSPAPSAVPASSGSSADRKPNLVVPGGKDKRLFPFEQGLPFSFENRVSDGAYALLMTVPISAMLGFVGTSVFPSYGWSLFIGIPFAVGMASAYLFGRNHLRSLVDCLGIATLAITILGAAVFIWAWEGLVCILMAAPIAYALAYMGALLGYNLQKKKNLSVHARRVILSMFIILPLTMAAEYASPQTYPTIAVHTTCVIKAPPKVVWENIIAFPHLAEPTEAIFKTGIAYPIGATIKGRGVGAVRHCTFTTGSFIEPITTWDEPRLLKFDVKAQPEPMREFSWVRDLQPAHLNHYLNIHKGEFRLSPMTGTQGREYTRIVGTTWYDNHMWPGSYWRLYADNIMHAIHTRVLMHIKTLSEKQQISKY